MNAPMHAGFPAPSPAVHLLVFSCYVGRRARAAGSADSEHLPFYLVYHGLNDRRIQVR